MTKLDEDGRPIRRADGKVLKGPRYRPPDISRVLRGDRE
jgi:Uma2 family endonuclease